MASVSRVDQGLPVATQLTLYRKMFAIRRFEQKAIELYSQSLIHGTIHAALGQEAACAGVIAALQPHDYVTSTHRGHGHALAKGAKMGPMFAELFGRTTGNCKGRGGSMHIADVSVGMLGANGIVAGSTSIAVGAALSGRLRGTHNVVACFFGDAGANQGSFFEAVNMAAIWKLPVLFVCENNQYGVSTRIYDVISVENVADRARGYGIPGLTLDGQDVELVYDRTRELADRARSGEGPCIIECKTYRYEGHNFGDPQVYRSKDEIEEWKQRRDPVVLYREKLRERGLEPEVARIEGEVERELQEAIAWALDGPVPDPDSVTDHVFVDDSPHPDLSGRRRVYRDEEV